MTLLLRQQSPPPPHAPPWRITYSDVCIYIGYAETIKTLAYCLTWQSWKKNHQ